MATYQYQPLTNRNQFRILQLDPGATADELGGSFVTTTFAYAPDFDTLSYVWGEASFTNRVSIAGCTILITDGLAAALRALRLIDRPKLLWVDAICINQDDIAERSQQVVLMADIYRKSKMTRVWLGIGDETSSHALQELKTIADSAARYGYTGSWELNGPMGITVLTESNISNLESEVVEVITKATESRAELIYDNVWFERLWIVQEAVVARELIIQLGDVHLEWRDFATATALISLAAYRTRHDMPWRAIVSRALDLIQARYNQAVFAPPEDLQRSPGTEQSTNLVSLGSVSSAGNVVRRMIENTSQNNKTLWLNTSSSENYLRKVWSLRYRRCMNDRDRVYGLRGFLPWDVPINITPDYSKTVVEVYIDFAKAMLDIDIVEVFTFAGLWNRVPANIEAGSPQVDAPIDECPSWVPELRLSKLASGSINPWEHPLEDIEVIRQFETPIIRWHKTNIRRVSIQAFVMGHLNIVAKPNNEFRNSWELLACVSEYLDIFAHTADLASQIKETVLTPYLDVLRLLGCACDCFGICTQRRARAPQEKKTPLTREIVDNFALLIPLDSSRDPSDIERLIRFLTDGRQILEHLANVVEASETSREGSVVPERTVEDLKMMLLIESLMRQLAARTFFTTTDFHLGFAPKAVLPRDVLVRFAGLLTPFVVRPVQGTSDFQIIGPCYVHGGVNITKGQMRVISIV
jgi:hypothetical protein